MREHVARFLQAFCEHYRDSGAIESVLLGSHRATTAKPSTPRRGNDWTANTHGKYHTHGGYWAGDPHAIASFRRWLRNKYETDEKL